MDMKINSTAKSVLNKRYLKKDKNGNVIETPEELFLRVANTIAKAELNYSNGEENYKKYKKLFYNMMINLDFLPNSPTLMNAGRSLGQLAACFVLPIEDSMESIFTTLKDAALIHKSGGGTGFSFSRLRPKNDIVKSTTGVASGPISFMKIFNSATEQVKQGGTRRGANMAILRVDHPDILDFIKCKDIESELNNFNISIGITKEFTDAYKNNEDYWLINPNDNKKVKKLNARYVLDLISKQAWKNGEPGIIFLEFINNKNTLINLGEIESTNPCVHKDTLIYTKNGLCNINDNDNLYNKKLDILVNDKIYKTTEQGAFPTGIKDLYKLETNEGYELICTLDQKLLNDKNRWIELKKILPGDKLKLNDYSSYYCVNGNYKKHDNGEAYIIGRLFGLGKNINNDLNEYIKELRMLLTVEVELDRLNKFDKTNLKESLLEIIKDLNIDLEKQTFDINLKDYSLHFYTLFIKGIYESIGFVNLYEKPNIGLQNLPYKTFKNIQLLLLYLGIKSSLEYSNSYYVLYIRNYSVIKFIQNLYNKNYIFNKKLRHSIDKMIISKKHFQKEDFTVTVKNISYHSFDVVYDVVVPGENRFNANGFIAHNCGEQPLLPYEACNLGSINLSNFVIYKDNKPVLDVERLRKTVILATRFLDNVIDVSKYPIKKIEDNVKSNRKIGLGIMGFADYLIKLGIPYNTHEAIEQAKFIMDFINSKAICESEELAKDRGAFPNISNSIFKKPRRNATVTTIAPTGSLSIIAGCSSGIEPIFSVCFERNILDKDDRFFEIHPIFEKMMNEANVKLDNQLLDRISKSNSIQNIKEIPKHIRDVFITSADVSYKYHISIQAAFQEFTENAVSKTINFPNKAKIEDIKKAFLFAHKMKCKGITVYRDGSRSIQVLNVKKEDNTIKNIRLSKIQRPYELKGYTIKLKTGLGYLYVTINELDGKPVEVFATVGKSGSSILAKTEAIGRLITLALKYEIPIEDIINQLENIGGEHPLMQKIGTVLSIPDGIAKILKKKYINKSDTNDVLCPECGHKVNMEEGCMICHKCGFSKCG